MKIFLNRQKSKVIYIMISLISALLIINCSKDDPSKKDPKNNPDNKKNEKIVKPPVKKKLGSDYFSESDPIDEKKIKPIFNQTARFIAGLSVKEDTKLGKISKSNNYLNYKKKMDQLWKTLQNKNISTIKQWREENLPASYNKMIFYPFSGPDTINPLSFFEKGRDFIMFGLERPGVIPQPHKAIEKIIMRDLWQLNQALNNILTINFFVTKKMMRFMGENTLSSITGTMMFFLSRQKYEILYVRKIWLDNKAKIIENTGNESKPKNGVNGVEIIFRKDKNAPVQRLRYYQINIIDASLRKHKNFVKYLNSQKTYTTIIKSASYILHNREFGKIRNIILSKSSQILQDDSGVPLLYYTKNLWKLTCFGYYLRPVYLFKGHFQKSLFDCVKKMSKGKLPFRYGYHYRPGESHLIFAEQIK